MSFIMKKFRVLRRTRSTTYYLKDVGLLWNHPSPKPIKFIWTTNRSNGFIWDASTIGPHLDTLDAWGIATMKEETTDNIEDWWDAY